MQNYSLTDEIRCRYITAIKTPKQMPCKWLYNPIIKVVYIRQSTLACAITDTYIYFYPTEAILQKQPVEPLKSRW